jgi:hypothetical protein
MTTFRISGVWKNDKGVITHYAVHTVMKDSTTRAKKISKSEALKLIKKTENKATTWIWDYTKSNWQVGENIGISSRLGEEYLRTDPDSTTRDNLSNLIDYDWVKP